MTLCGWCGSKMLGYGRRCPACVRRERGAFGAALVAIVLLIGVTLLCGCATVRKGLDAAHVTGVAAREVAQGDALCRPVLERCKAAKVYPCPALDKCQAAQLAIMRGVETLQRTILAGWRAQALGQDPTAAKALTTAVQLVAETVAALKTWGVSL